MGGAGAQENVGIRLSVTGSEGKAAGTARRPRSWQEMREQEIRWLVDRTGEGLETWNARLLEMGFTD